jgi:hypothetical protein
MVNGLTKKDQKSLSKNNSRAFSKLKQKVRKNNKKYDEEIKKFLAKL